MSFGTNLQYLRKMRNAMTQEDLAELRGVSRQTVAKWESDAAYPEIEKLVRIAEFFSCTADQLLREDINSGNEAYSPVRIETVGAFRMARYAVISHAPEDDAINHIQKWAQDNGILKPQIIGWDFPFVSQQQVNVFHMHGYAAACILPADFISKRNDVEIAAQEKAKYAVITITQPFRNPFLLIPNAYKTIHSYLKVNGIKQNNNENILSCFEKVYQEDAVDYMDIFISINNE